MICDPQPTSEINWQGRVVYVCPHCGRRIAPRGPEWLGEAHCRNTVAAPESEPVRHTAETLPCVHRGEPTGEEVECGCGERGVMLPVYSCALKTRCTIVSPGRIARVGGRKVAVCFQQCDERRAE